MNRMFKWFLHLGLIAVFGLPTAFADSNIAANQLFVETAKLLLEAKQAPVERQLELYQRALANLDKIVAQYPSSDLAVKLVSGQAIGKIDRAEIEVNQREAKKAVCYQQPAVECIIMLALDFARAINLDKENVDKKNTKMISRHTIWGFIAVAQVEMGDKEAARMALQEALDAARSVKASDRCGLGLIAVAQAKMGDQEGAQASIKNLLETARCELLSLGFHGFLFLTYIVEAQVAIGDKEGARATIKEVLDPAVENKQGARATVKETLNAIRQMAKSDYGRANISMFLGFIAMMQAEIGDKEDARATIKEALDIARTIKAGDRYVLAVIAMAQAETGDKQGAQATAKEALDAIHVIENKETPAEQLLRAEYLGFIAMAQAEMGDKQGAQATLKETDLFQQVAAVRPNKAPGPGQGVSGNDVFAAFVLAHIAAQMAKAQHKL